MLRRLVRRFVRLVLVALILASPLAAADPAPTIRNCTQVSCFVLQDSDGDGDYEWANVALVAGEQVVVNANANNTTALWEVDATDEELGGEPAEELARDVGETTGVELRVVTVSATGSANLTAQDGSPGFHDADVLVAVLLMDHDTGEQEAVVWQYARVYDSDGDSLPDGVETLP